MTTKTAQFTPGPWVVTEHSAGMVCVAGPDHKDLCAVGYNRTEGRNDVANATLIAAAPAMYEALQDIENYTELGLNSDEPKHWEASLQDILGIVRDALAQAEGRQHTPVGENGGNHGNR